MTIRLINFEATRPKGKRLRDGRKKPGGPIRRGNHILVGIRPEKGDPCETNPPNYVFAQVAVALAQGNEFFYGPVIVVNNELVNSHRITRGTGLICEHKHVFAVDDGEVPGTISAAEVFAEVVSANCKLETQNMKLRQHITGEPNPN